MPGITTNTVIICIRALLLNRSRPTLLMNCINISTVSLLFISISFTFNMEVLRHWNPSWCYTEDSFTVQVIFNHEFQCIRLFLRCTLTASCLSTPSTASQQFIQYKPGKYGCRLAFHGLPTARYHITVESVNIDGVQINCFQFSLLLRPLVC